MTNIHPHSVHNLSLLLINLFSHCTSLLYILTCEIKTCAFHYAYRTSYSVTQIGSYIQYEPTNTNNLPSTGFTYPFGAVYNPMPPWAIRM